MKKIIALAIVGLLTINSSIVSNAAVKEDSSKTITQNINVSKETKVPSGVPQDIIIRPSSNNKEKYLEEADQYINNLSSDMFSIAATTFTLYNKNQVDNIKGSYIYAKLDTDITYGVFTDLRANGSSRIYWGGTNPIRCTTIKMEDSFYITGVGVGFSFSSDGKWTVTPKLTSATATWSESYDDEYAIDHIYDNLDFNGYEVYIKQSTTGYFTFSTTTYQTTAVDSSLL